MFVPFDIKLIYTCLIAIFFIICISLCYILICITCKELLIVDTVDTSDNYRICDTTKSNMTKSNRMLNEVL